MVTISHHVLLIFWYDLGKFEDQSLFVYLGQLVLKLKYFRLLLRIGLEKKND